MNALTWLAIAYGIAGIFWAGVALGACKAGSEIWGERFDVENFWLIAFTLPLWPFTVMAICRFGWYKGYSVKDSYRARP